MISAEIDPIQAERARGRHVIVGDFLEVPAQDLGRVQADQRSERQLRKVTYRLYPTPKQAEEMRATLRSHQQLYNAALEERVSAWQKSKTSISYAQQCASLTTIRRELPEWATVNCSSQQMTLRRLDKAFKSFFQRVKTGNKPGFPRFKSLDRFPGFGFKGHGDGWRFTPGNDWRHGSLRLSGIGQIRCRGQSRQRGAIKASELLYRAGQWFLSLTVEPDRIERLRTDNAAIGLDWGVGTLLSGVRHDGTPFTLKNPRWFQTDKERLTLLQQAVSRKKRGSGRRRAAIKMMAKARAVQARKRLDFLHKESAKIAATHALVAMEELTIKSMTRSAAGTVEEPGRNVAQKAGLNREILDTAPALFMRLIRYKVLETGGDWAEAPTRKLKPSQTCPGCGDRAVKTLNERVHHCQVCGLTQDRDRASAQVTLNWAMFGTPTAPASSTVFRSGTGQCSGPIPSAELHPIHWDWVE